MHSHLLRNAFPALCRSTSQLRSHFSKLEYATCHGLLSDNQGHLEILSLAQALSPSQGS